jgi:hypothetical protein
MRDKLPASYRLSGPALDLQNFYVINQHSFLSTVLEITMYSGEGGEKEVRNNLDTQRSDGTYHTGTSGG